MHLFVLTAGIETHGDNIQIILCGTDDIPIMDLWLEYKRIFDLEVAIEFDKSGTNARKQVIERYCKATGVDPETDFPLTMCFADHLIKFRKCIVFKPYTEFWTEP